MAVLIAFLEAALFLEEPKALTVKRSLGELRLLLLLKININIGCKKKVKLD